MTGGTRIITIGGGDDVAQDNAEEAPNAGLESQAAPDQPEAADWDLDAAPPGDHERLPAAAAIGAAVIWTGIFIWLKSGVAPALPAAEWPGLIGEWALPVVLICAIWLLVMRHSRREATRFGHVAQRLAQESTLLETRLTTVNRELSLAREFIAAQSRDLESIGRVAAERLSQNADRLQTLIRENDARVAEIGSVSSAALENMEKLRNQLPVIASSTKDVTNNIGAAGHAAQAQLNDLIDGFTRLTECGQASERQVSSLRGQVDEAVAEFTSQADQWEKIASARFAALSERGAEFRTELDGHEVAALAAMQSRASAMAAEFEQARQQLDSQETESLAALRARLTDLREEGAAIARAMSESESRAAEAWRETAGQMQETIAARVATLTEALEQTRAQVAAAETESLAAMEGRVTALRGMGEDVSQSIRARQEQAVAAFSADADALNQQLRQAEDRALGLWRAAIERLGEDLRGALATIEMADVDAAHAAQVRFAALSAEADRLETTFAERQRAFDAERDRRRAASLADDEQAITLLAERLAAVDGQIAERFASHQTQGAALADHVATIGARLDQFESQLAAIATHGERTETQIGAHLAGLTAKLVESGAALTGTDQQITALTESSVRLLELLQASAEMTRETLPRAIGVSEQSLTTIEHRAAELDASIGGALQRGEELSSFVSSAGTHLNTALAEMDALQNRLAERSGEHRALLADLRVALDELETRNNRVAQQARDELSASIQVLAQASQEAVGALRTDGASAISELAGRLGEESASSIDRAMRASAADASEQLQQAAARAAHVAREAASHLHDQLGKVDELAGNLERRVAQAREQAEEQVDGDFTRRVAALTEALNSNAIDIAKALSSDVSDVAWSAYLRGDRGIFTRRAVKLIETGEAKAIAQLYGGEEAFRDNVRRYIHDFEAILRQVLSSRDGHALGVTLLSSDMGKLYVALAQAIERLR